jgi:6-phosphofructokinase 1
MLTGGNCIIGQSGGPTVAINASLSGVLEGVLESKAYGSVFGMINGIEGLLQGTCLNLSEKFPTKESLEVLKTTPAMYLGSCRFKLPSSEEREDLYVKLFEFFKQNDIRTFFYIGGNDSMDTVLKLSSYAKSHNIPMNILGIPKTIDNDLAVTDHTPGFGSAAKYIATTLLEVAHDAYIYNSPSVTIVEIMGRNAGWLTASSALCKNEYFNGPDLIYLPEISFCKEEFIKDLKEIQKERKNIIVAVSEGIRNKDGQLCGAGKALENIVKESIDCKVRSIELNVLQRASSHLASLTDLDEAVLVGKEAVKQALLGSSAKMMGYKRISSSPYQIEVCSYDIADIANKEKVIPREWINEKGNHVTNDFITYALPLIQGEVRPTFIQGMPNYAPIPHLQ